MRTREKSANCSCTTGRPLRANHGDRVMSAGASRQAISLGSRHGPHEKIAYWDRCRKPCHRQTVSGRRTTRRRWVWASLSSPETRLVGQTDPELLPQDHGRPRKLASRSVFRRTAQSLRTRDSHVRLVSALSADEAAWRALLPGV